MLYNIIKPFAPIIKLNKIFYTYENQQAKLLFEEKINRIIDSFCISKIGRVEAVHISPNFKKIAYASFDLNKIVIFDIKFNKKIKIEDCIFVDCQCKSPHDFAWLDDSKIVVANREGPPIIFEVPNKSCSVNPLLTINDMIDGTNSVTFLKKDKTIRLIFCNKYDKLLFFDIENFEIKSKGMYLENLSVPDGVSISPSKKWMAITNALKDNIIIYNLEKNKISSILENIKRPHGVDFFNDNLLVSSGGGDQFIYFWDFKNKSIKFKVKALSSQQFKLRGSDIEGGIKGVCCCPELNLLFLTCPNAPFLIFETNNL